MTISRTQSQVIAKAIQLAGGAAEVAAELEYATQWAVSKWKRDGVPAKHVIDLCRLGGWKVTPHQVDRSLYPSRDDGLPAEMKQSIVAAVR